MSTVILWATQVLESNVSNPQFALGAPDAQAVGLNPKQFITVSTFSEGRIYSDLLSLLNGKAGDAVTAPTLARAKVIAFELNGYSPAPSGGWESCQWVFDDGSNSVSVGWDERVGAPRPAEVVANGSTDKANYAAFFGIAQNSPLLEKQDVISYILFDIPEGIDFASPQLKITVKWWEGTHGEGTPDPEAIGILPCNI
jgi:hypothetical protein